MTMSADYFDTRFRLDTPVRHWPDEFVIVSAYQTTGEQWPDEVNQAADKSLEQELKQHFDWLVRITGYLIIFVTVWRQRHEIP